MSTVTTSKLATLSAALVAVAMLAGSAGTASAHSSEARQSAQLSEIEAGRRDGSITFREGIALRKEQREIARVRAAMEADGRLTREERRVLRTMQEHANAAIETEANDNSHRASFLPRFGR